jgi:hypothetical protein
MQLWQIHEELIMLRHYTPVSLLIHLPASTTAAFHFHFARTTTNNVTNGAMPGAD